MELLAGPLSSSWWMRSSWLFMFCILCFEAAWRLATCRELLVGSMVLSLEGVDRY